MVGSDGDGWRGRGLDQTLCNCGSFSMICQWSCTDLEYCLRSAEYGVTTGRTVLELDALEVLWRRMSWEWKKALEMLRVMVPKGYFLGRRDTVKELSSFCSVVSSAMKTLYLRV